MQKNILIIFLIGILLIIPNQTNAYSLKRVDSKSFTIEESSEREFTVNSEDYEFEGNKVYAYLVKDKKENMSQIILEDIENSNYICKKNSYEKCLIDISDDLLIIVKDGWIKDNLYAHIIIVSDDDVTYTNKPIELKQKNAVSTYEVNERYSFENKVTKIDGNHIDNILYLTPKTLNKNVRRIKAKIGTIRNLNLLKKLRYEDEDAYIELIKYAKKDKNGLDLTLEFDKKNKKNYQIDIKHLNVINGAYYYIYIEENNNVQEGIMFAQGNLRLLNSEVAWPDKTLMTIGIIFFIIDMSLPILVIGYFVINTKEEF